jgi:multidrug resistance efflux pump
MKVHHLIPILALILTAGCNNKTASNEAKAITAANAQPTQIVAIGRVEPESKITAIGAQVGGLIRHIYIHAGDSVIKGQPLIELVHDYEDALLAQSLSKLATQHAEIENVSAQLNSVKIKNQNLKVKLQRIKNMYAQDADTKQNVDNAQTDYDQSLADIDRYTALLNSAQKTLAQYQTDINVVKAQIDQKTVRAPGDGLILNMDLTEGSSVSVEKSLFDFAPASPLTVLCEVDELYYDKVKKGQPAYIRNQGMSERIAEGEVIFLSPYIRKKSIFSDDSNNMEDRRVREVRILIKGHPKLLFNSRVEAVIQI